MSIEMLASDLVTLRRVKPLRTVRYRAARRRLADALQDLERATASSVSTTPLLPGSPVRTFHDVLLVNDGMNLPALLRPTPPVLERLRAGGVTLHTSALPGAVSTLTGGGGLANYFHWLIDLLPRYLAAADAADVARCRVIVPSHDLPFQRATLEQLGIDEPRRLVLGRFEAVRCETLIEAEHPRPPGGAIPPELVSLLRDRLTVHRPEMRRQLPERFYVRRGDAPSRRICDEAALEGRLASLGVEPISLSQFTFAEQQALFRQATLVVGPHGAGLTNALFAGPATRLVELTGGGWGGPFFEEICRHVGTQYVALEALASSPVRLVRRQHSSLRVRNDRLDDLLRLV